MPTAAHNLSRLDGSRKSTEPMNLMSSKPKWWFIVALLILSLPVFAQGQSQQQLPDAPSAKPLPNKPAPAPIPPQDAGPPLDTGAPANGTPAATQPDPAGGTSSSSGSSSSSSGTSSGGRAASGGGTNPLTGETSLPPAVEPKPMPPITRHTTPAAAEGNSRDELPVFTSNVNFVTVPVTVKDSSGRILPGLLSNDFTVYENGVRQDLKYFTSDPFPLSAAVVVDMGLPEQVLDKV